MFRRPGTNRFSATFQAGLVLGLLLGTLPIQAVSAQTAVSFPTMDGGMVYADLYGEGGRGVVLVHGGRFNKESWAGQVPALVGAGFRVLAIDLRGYGRSRGGNTLKAGDDGFRYDVLAAVRYLHRQGAAKVSIIGGSMGGGAAAEAAVEARPGEIDGLVLLAHSAIDHPERMQGRKFFIVARGDTFANGRPRLTRIREQYEKAPGPKRLLVLDGSAHAQYVFDTAEGETTMSEIVEFLGGEQ
ncbi:MAG: alpha/beta hydrolase [Gemmatimonadales bacterium]